MKTEKQERRKIQSAEGKTPIAASRPHLVRLTTHPEPALRLGRGKRRHEAPPTGWDGHMRRSSVQIASSPRAEGGGGDEAALGHASEFRHSLSHLHTDRHTHSSQNITRKIRKEKKKVDPLYPSFRRLLNIRTPLRTAAAEVAVVITIITNNWWYWHQQ